MKKIFFFLLFLLFSQSTFAFGYFSKYGMHLLHPYELSDAIKLVRSGYSDRWSFVTIPISLGEVGKKREWDDFCKRSYSHNIIPIFRLTGQFKNGSWEIPNRRELINLIDFIENLECPHSDLYIIVFNEMNHAGEWGGKINPVSYAKVLKFTYNWAKSESKNFIVLPGALDLAADGRNKTMKAFEYYQKMYDYDNNIFNYLDYWNSHSYPNPAFSSHPLKDSHNSLSGFKHELEFLKDKTNKDLKVFITETGWKLNRSTINVIRQYYLQAHQAVWSDSRIVAITPFLFKGSPGPFSQFSFLDENNKPTLNYLSYQRIIEIDSLEKAKEKELNP
jgi:hypothetical protein